MKKIKKLIVLMLLLVMMSFAGCSKKDKQSSEIEAAKKEKIAEEAKMWNDGIVNESIEAKNKNDVGMENKNIISNSDGNRKAVTVSYQLSIPDSYTRVNHNDHIYVYDSKGDSLSVSNQSLEIKVDEYSENNCHKLISSGYKNVELKKLEHVTINKMKAICIEYTGSKNDKKFMNCCYYIENGESIITIDIQAIDKSNYSKLKSVAEEIKF